MQSLALIIPLKNEEDSIETLFRSINRQTLQPSEIVFVDGGSTDTTVKKLKGLAVNSTNVKIIEAGKAMPGKGRNIGAEKTSCEWIAFTDAGIKLEKDWLEKLVTKAKETPNADIVYGNYAPQLNSLFDKCATIAYVPHLKPDAIREKFIASSMIKKSVWKKAGGFPDWRAAEDLIFMEKAEQDAVVVTAPDAMVRWQLRPDLLSTYKRFDLYSKYNVWAGRQAFWHYGVARQYAVILFFIVLAVFHSWYWLLGVPLWIGARVAKRILSHRFEFGLQPLFNPAAFFLIAIITLVIDAATFAGWIKALLQKKPVS